MPSLLVRRTDVAEDVTAWVLATLALLAVLGAVLVGRAAYTAELGPHGPGAPVPIRAELLADAPSPAGPAARPVPEVPIAWTRADGTEQTGELRVREPLRAGMTVAAWVDQDGQVTTTPPARGVRAAAFGVGATLTAVAFVWTLLGLVWLGTCRITAARNDAAWAREWARVEPEWRRRVR